MQDKSIWRLHRTDYGMLRGKPKMRQVRDVDDLGRNKCGETETKENKRAGCMYACLAMTCA